MSFAADSENSIQHALPKITILYDNRNAEPALQEGFGFSCLVEWKDRTILFDTGGNGEAFFKNTDRLSIDLSKVSHVFFSHHHWDHTAAIDQILTRISPHATVHLPSPFSTTLENKIPPHVRIRKISSFEQIEGGIYSLVLKGSDWFRPIYEQALLLKTSKGVVVITGCAHPGIVNIVREAKAKIGPIHLVMGGFHLYHSWRCTSLKVVQQLEKLSIEKVAPCHCAGKTAIDQCKQTFKSNFIQTGTGTVIQV